MPIASEAETGPGGVGFDGAVADGVGRKSAAAGRAGRHEMAGWRRVGAADGGFAHLIELLLETVFAPFLTVRGFTIHAEDIALVETVDHSPRRTPIVVDWFCRAWANDGVTWRCPPFTKLAAPIVTHSTYLDLI